MNKFKTVIVICLILFQSCRHEQRKIVKHNGKKDLISFAKVLGIDYSEVYRRTANGLSFNDAGYQLEPQWDIKFLSNDSAAIYSPIKKQVINFPLTCGYDSIFNTARTWYKAKIITKDSLKLELLESFSDSLDTKGTGLFLTFYANRYIKNVLHSDVSALRRPSRADTLFIKKLSLVANKDYTKSFAARQPVKLIPKNAKITVEKRAAKPDFLHNFDTSEDYMNPTFDIVIRNAYSKFYYSFSMFVDAGGQLHYSKPLIVADENYKYLSKAVMTGYLNYYLNFTPGKTLDIIHSSEINVHVKGIPRQHIN